jgi:hypothetical protein
VRTAITLWRIAAIHALLFAAGSVLAADAPAAAWKSPAQAGRPAPKSRPAGDKAIIHAVADALGFVRGVGRSETTNTLNRLQWGGSGKMTDGTVVSGVSHYRYTLSLHLKAAREDYEYVSDGKPQRVVQVVAGEDAWDEQEPGVDGHMNPGSARARQLQLARTPFGFVRWLLDADPSTVNVIDGPNKVSISLPIDRGTGRAAPRRVIRP